MNVETTLKANAQLSETGKPGMCALAQPSVPHQPLFVFHSAPGNARRDSSLFQLLTAARKVVSLTRP